MFRREKKERSFDLNQAGYLRPENFGFQQVAETSWKKELAGQDTFFSKVDWQNIPALEAVTSLQGPVWGMGERDLVPSNLLAIAGDSGGDVIIAQDQRGNLEGFVFTMGTIEGRLILHMIGVDPKLRYRKDLGWNLSMMQGSLAKARGISQIDWTYDPLRGSNARLNLEKLGAKAFKYTVNKYGRVHSDLYGENPTDRFTVRWDLDSNQTKKRLEGMNNGTYKPLDLNTVAHLPVVNQPTQDIPTKFLVEVPYDVDSLQAKDSAAWRMQLRNVLQHVLTCETDSGKIERQSLVSGFATGLDNNKQRRSFYVIDTSTGLR